MVSDVKDAKLDAAPEPQIYMSYAQVPLGKGIAVVARTTLDPGEVATEMRQAIATLDRTQAVYDIQTLETVLDDSIASRRLTTLLLEVFAGTALLLVVVGLHGVMAFFVGQRTREIGVRLAAGATARSVWLFVVRKGLTLTVAGLILGVAFAMAATGLLRAALYEVSPTDRVTLISATLVIVVFSLVACGGPAFRAAVIDPVRTRRAE